MLLFITAHIEQDGRFLTDSFFSSVAEAHWFVTAGLPSTAGLLPLCFFLEKKRREGFVKNGNNNP